MIGIYKIENLVNHKIYIGQSTDITKRWRNEKTRAFNSLSVEYNSPLARAFRKYGIENFSFSVLEECTKELLNQREQYWADYYNSYIPLGYNVARCGNSEKRLPEWFNQVVELLKQNKSNHEIANIVGCISWRTVSDVNCGRAWYQDNMTYPIRKKVITENGIVYSTEKTVSKKKEIALTKEEILEYINKNIPYISAEELGKAHNISAQQVRKYMKKYGLLTMTEYKRNFKIKTKTKKEVLIKGINLKTNEEHIFHSFAEASKYVSGDTCNSGHIREACEGKRRTAHGYHWIYLNDCNPWSTQNQYYEESQCPTIEQSKRGKPVICLETKEIFSSIKETRERGISNVSKVCNGEGITSGGYHWAFLKDYNSWSKEKQDKYYKP